MRMKIVCSNYVCIEPIYRMFMCVTTICFCAICKNFIVHWTNITVHEFFKWQHSLCHVLIFFLLPFLITRCLIFFLLSRVAFFSFFSSLSPHHMLLLLSSSSFVVAHPLPPSTSPQPTPFLLPPSPPPQPTPFPFSELRCDPLPLPICLFCVFFGFFWSVCFAFFFFISFYWFASPPTFCC